ncbi:MAG: hypothetical protein ACRDP6_16065 [Actinoallomurus sp.]
MRLKAVIGRLMARQTDRRRDWVGKVSTEPARRFDLIRVEDLKIMNMVRSARGTIAAPGTNHADVNAAKNIAAGHAVTARGALQPSGGAMNREPQPVPTSIQSGLESPATRRGRTSTAGMLATGRGR